ncbi:MAG: hypothetical protein ABI068_16270 [Ktedonobacterales bacterium]
MGPLIIAVLLGLACILIVVQPLLGLERATTDETETPATIAEVAERERLAKQALREVDLDYRLGNLDNADYETLHDRYERRALAAIKVRYQREQELDSLIERQLATLRQQDVRKHSATAQRKTRNGATTGATGAAITERADTQETSTASARHTTSAATHRNAHTPSVRDRRTSRRKGV